ncbi:2,3-diphosphoglycerate-dependent phosphoglycerate mutase [Arcicella rosea]|uniref:2,3-bisphosphoglycerate-dependent phosphoglycerate mutase n=1 Tax=Arcicella rosea TaxID=502909 RepID=A0A841EL95_9BACT|nr:2,3-bisphosphoglycerate-dependent phosphoglycerate mutase [Arcicella rosea]MBB6004392.1 2,3-bisphosphoglycerate-dependent phosphoglycerate mutase [Arcicella rosea]
MAILTLIRHGQSTYNLENRFTGNVDVELTVLGEKEALLSGEKIKAIHYDFAYTSTLKRAKKSLTIILAAIHQTNIPIISNAALDERMYGDLQGLNKAETAAKYGEAQVLIWRRSFAVRPPNGESLEDTFNRTIPYYQTEIEPKLKNGDNILIVAHGNSLRALMMYLEKIDSEEISKVNIPTGLPRNYTFDKQLNIKTVEYL